MYELLDADFAKVIKYGEGGRYIGTSFVNRLHAPDDTNTYKFIDSFTLKEYFIHLLEKPVDDVTRLSV